jgi:hypothetical protein
MKFFKTIWKKLKGLFTKRAPSAEQIISEEKSVLVKSIKVEDIYIKIQASTDEKEKEILIKQIARQQVAKGIIEFVENESSPTVERKRHRKNLYELHELRTELQKLEEQKAALQIAKLKIQPISYPDTTEFDSRIKKLFSLLSKNKINDKVELSDFTVSAFDKDFKLLEKLLSDKSTLKRHASRERENKKKREIYESNIKKELNNLDSLISLNKLDDAKLLISRLSKSIKSDYKKGIERLSIAVTKLDEKELQVFKKRQTELLRQQEEEAERIRIEQEQIFKQQRIDREQAEARKKIEEAKKIEKENKRKALLTKKFNWRDFQRVLQENGITAFYHFTDYHNLKSIKDNDGLYSWHYADSNSIVINFPGGDTLSRDLDKRYGLQDYVRVSFCIDHPMQYRLKQRGRNLALLEVDIEVAYYENTIFCNINATDSSHQKGTAITDLEKIKFSATKRRFVSREDPDFKQHQAEVLVKTWIPLEHIKNINNFA